MTLADMSVITAEVKVDETDIVNVKLGQPADVTIDAIPKQDLQGHGHRDRRQRHRALHRRRHLADDGHQPGSQGLQGRGDAAESADRTCGPACRPRPRSPLRPRSNVLTIPIQALTVRREADLEPRDGQRIGHRRPRPGRRTSSRRRNSGCIRDPQRQSRVRPGRDRHQRAPPTLKSLKGLKEGDEIVTGSYKVLRTLKPGTSVKVDNSAPKKEEESS